MPSPAGSASSSRIELARENETLRSELRDALQWRARATEYMASSAPRREAMAKAAREEMKQWDWEAATSYLRNVQYQKALDNFQNKPVDVIPTSNLAWDIDNRSPLDSETDEFEA